MLPCACVFTTSRNAFSTRAFLVFVPAAGIASSTISSGKSIFVRIAVSPLCKDPYLCVPLHGHSPPIYNRVSMLSPLPLIVGSAAAAGLTAVVAYGTMHPASQLFGRTLVAPPLPYQLALTFDDGPNPAATPRLLEVLARRNIRATFFLIGDFVRLEPALTREIAAAGHAIGNHTWSHPFLPRHRAAYILDQLTRCNDILESTLAQRVELFRAPHGGRSPAVFRATKQLRLITVQWNLIPGDWSGETAAHLLAKTEHGIAINRQRNRGTCVVLHDGGQSALNQPRLPTVRAVEALLDRLPRETTFVTPSSCGWPP
jgi:peptidoglycan/xylan/chitin deacetylase (PgdA/CDA1 family)